MHQSHIILIDNTFPEKGSCRRCERMLIVVELIDKCCNHNLTIAVEEVGFARIVCPFLLAEQFDKLVDIHSLTIR